jgi:beta-lactam-binding protein with PASTA domain/V8-like Glu-specific endopeptidase
MTHVQRIAVSTFALLAFFFMAAQPANAAGMRADLHDTTCYTAFNLPLGQIATPSTCQDATKEQRYYTLANGTRFDAVGAFRMSGRFGGHFCSGTVIGPYTVLTAAHCMDYPPDHWHVQRPSDPLPPNPEWTSAEWVDFVLGPNIYTTAETDYVGAPQTVAGVTETLRVVDWQEFGWNPITKQNDYALVQVYDAQTNGPVQVPGVQLYGEGLEAQQLYVPVFVGYGIRGYGAPTQAGQTAGASGYSPLTDGVKRAFLVGDFAVSFDGSLIVDSFDSVGYITTQLHFPSNFLEGHITPGDSGGGLFYYQPTGSPASWAVAGVASSVGVPNVYNSSSTTRTGDSTGNYTRIAPIASALYNAQYVAPLSFWHAAAAAGAPAALVFNLPGSGTATLYSPVVLACDSPPVQFGLTLAASDPAVAINVSFGSSIIGSFSGLGLAGVTESLAFTPGATSDCITESGGTILAFLNKALQITVSGPAGATVRLSGLSLPGLPNADFSSGTAGWNITGPTSASTVPIGAPSVPNVVGLTQAAATAAITGAGLTVGNVTTQASPTVPAGSVISQSPPAGTSVTAGSAVNLVISSGPAPVSVPNVVGLTQAAATAAITGAGLTVGNVTTQASPTVPAGTVISQSPSAGTSVTSGSAVTLVVSSGPSVPNVVGLTQAAATSAITGAGLTLGSVTRQTSPTVPAGTVISQSPSAGTSVTAGSAVNLVISSGPAPVSVPNLVGLTQAAATSAITGAGLTVGNVTTQTSPTVPAGTVISQSPPPGTSVTSGSAVNVVVSSGTTQAPSFTALRLATLQANITPEHLKTRLLGLISQAESLAQHDRIRQAREMLERFTDLVEDSEGHIDPRVTRKLVTLAKELERSLGGDDKGRWSDSNLRQQDHD